MTAIALAGSATNQTALANLAVTKPSGGTITDIVVAQWAATGVVPDANMLLPTGWTQLAHFSPAGGPTVKIAYKALVAGSEPANYTFSLTGTPVIHGVTMTRWSNVDTSQISDAYVPYTTNAGSSLTPTALDVVPVTDGAVLLAFFASPAGTITPPTTPTAFTTAATINTNIRNVTSYASQATAGHSGDLAATLSATGAWTAILWPLRPLDLGTPITVTVDAVKPMPSNLELTMTMVDSSLINFGTPPAYVTATLPNMQGVYSRLATFLGGFGLSDPLYNWDGTGTVPAVGEIRGGVKVFDMAGTAQLFLNVATTLGLPLDFIIWRLPWQFTNNPGTTINSTKGDYYGVPSGPNPENRRIRSDRVADFQTYLQRAAAWLIAKGVTRFKIGSEWKGFQLDTYHSPVKTQTWDWFYCYQFFTYCQDAIYAGADDAHVARTNIEIASPYIVTEINGVTSADAFTGDSWVMETGPTPQTMRAKDPAIPPQWSLNNPGWAYPDKEGIKGVAELLKLAINANRRIDMFGIDFGQAYADAVAKTTDMFYLAEQMTRDMVRWARWTLQNIGDGRLANIPIDIAEYYVKPVATIAQTTNTYTLTVTNPDGSKTITHPPISTGPYLPANQYRPYFAALKAIGLAVCVEEGVRTPCWWGYDNEGNARSVPHADGSDQQAWYGESFVHQNAIADGEVGVTEGAITTVGLMNKWFNQNFSAGTRIRAVTVSDPTKIYALPNLSKALVVNKTAGRKSVIVNGVATTLAPYEWQEVVYSNSYTLVGTTGSYTSTGNNATLKFRRKIVAASAGSYAASGQAARLIFARRLSATAGSYIATGQSAGLIAVRRLTAQVGSYVATGNSARLIKTPPVSLIAQPGAYTSTGYDAQLTFTRKITGQTGSYGTTGQNATLAAVRRLVASAAGSYSASGNDALLTFVRRLSAVAGSYVTTGQDAILAFTRRIVASTGSYGATGNNATLAHGFTLIAQSGAYAVTGNNAGLLIARKLTGQAGSYVATGNNADLIYIPINHYLLVGQAGQYITLGYGARLTFVRRLIALAGAYESTGYSANLHADHILTALPGSYVSSGSDARLTFSQEIVETLPLDRVYVVPPENRILAIEAENRTLVIEPENRTFIVQ